MLNLGVILAFSVLGFWFNDLFSQFRFLVVPLLVVIMLSMGATLTFEDFSRVLKIPYALFFGAFLQYTVMPLLGFSVAKVLGVGRDDVIGFVLVGSAPGGTASNVITFLAGGNVAYSVSMTALSTLLSPLATPFCSEILLGKRVEVPFLKMVITTAKIVVFPVVFGMLISPFVGRFKKYFPYLAIFSIGFILAIIFALNRARIETLPPFILLGILIHNILGFAFGWILGKLFLRKRDMTVALSVEVGMQNSGLAMTLCMKFFSTASALVPAIFSLVQNINGILLATFVKSRGERRT